MFYRAGTTALAVLLFACGAALPASDPLADDRLDQKVNLQVEGMSLGELLPRLSRVTGVPLRADREAAEDKVVILGPDRPLREVLADLAALLGHRWERRSERGEVQFVLVRDPEIRKKEAKLAESPEQVVLRHLQDQVRALREPRSRLERRPENDPIRRALLDPKFRQATAFFALLNSRQRELLIERGCFRLFFPALPPPYQAALQDLHRANQVPERSTGPLGLTIRRRREPPDADFTLRIHRSGRTSAWFYPGGARFAMFDVRSNPPPIRGNPYNAEPVDLDASLPSIDESLVQGTIPRVERLRRLAEATGVPVVADFHRLEPSQFLHRDQKPGPDAADRIDALARRLDSAWWLRGRTLLFRSRDWFRRRDYEIPDRWFDEMVRRLRRNEEPTLGALLRLETLTFKQLIGLWCLNARGMSLTGTQDYHQRKLSGVPEVLDILKGFRGRASAKLVNWDRLSKEEQREIGPALPLRAEQMSPAQRALILPLLAIQRREPDGLYPETFRITVQCRNPRAAKYREGYRYVPVELFWHTKGTGGDVDLPLPLTVPDDRRASAVIRAEGTEKE